MMNKVELLEEVEMMTEDDVIEGMEERSLEEIINEVAEEENLTPEEVAQMIEDFRNTKIQVAKKKRYTKPKKVKNKNKIKQAKQSKKRNR